MVEMDEVFEKQVYKASINSFAIIIPSKIIKKYGIEPGDVIAGKFVFLNKQEPKV